MNSTARELRSGSLGAWLAAFALLAAIYVGAYVLLDYWCIVHFEDRGQHALIDYHAFVRFDRVSRRHSTSAQNVACDLFAPVHYVDRRWRRDHWEERYELKEKRERIRKLLADNLP